MEKSFIFIIILLLLTPYPTTLQGAPRKAINKHHPCKRFVLYYHDNLFTGHNAQNATSYSINASEIIGPQFGQVVVFDDPMTADHNLGSPPVARAQGMYFYYKKDGSGSWFAFSVVFNSTDYKGTIDIVGNDIIPLKKRVFSVVGGTGDFFMTRGVVTVTTDLVVLPVYFRVKMDIKLYECY